MSNTPIEVLFLSEKELLLSKITLRGEEHHRQLKKLTLYILAP